MVTAAELVAQTDQLASLPTGYLRIKRVIDDPNSSTAQLAEAIMTDAAMTARVLRVVNSPFYGFSGPIETVTRAINVLGVQQVHNVVLAWAISSSFGDVVLPLKAFWRKSVARAITARQLARQANFSDTERLFVAGLLSDIGHLVMYMQVPDLALDALDQSGPHGRPLHEVEREIIGCDYAEVGAALVSAWGLPLAFSEAIACQIEPSAAIASRMEAAMLHVAGCLAELTLAAFKRQPDPQALAILNLDDDALTDLRAQMSLELEGVVSIFFPKLAVT